MIDLSLAYFLGYGSLQKMDSILKRLMNKL